MLSYSELERFYERIVQTLRGLRPYVSSVRKARAGRICSLKEEHQLRLRCAEESLPATPLKDYGLERMIEESKTRLTETGLLPQSALAWLPEVMIYFRWLNV
jgi:hypothetical protein